MADQRAHHTHTREIGAWTGDVICAVCKQAMSYWHPGYTVNELGHQCVNNCRKQAQR